MEDNNLIVPATFDYDDYEKISDDLIWLGYSSTNKCSYLLRFNVSLSNISKDGKKIPFHTEYRYETRKYTNVFAGNTIRRHITFYMSIESSKQDEFGNKDFIMIRPSDIIYLQRKLAVVETWFTSNSVYKIKDNRLIVTKKTDIMIDGLSQQKYMIMSPIVIEDNGAFIAGVRVVLNNSNTFDMKMDTFYEFLYTINSIDMYNAASTLMAYFGRPPFGTNMWNPNDMNKTYEQQEPDVDKLEGNKRRRRKTFFD